MSHYEDSFDIKPTGTRWLWHGESNYRVDNRYISFHRFGKRRAEREARRQLTRQARREGQQFTVQLGGDS